MGAKCDARDDLGTNEKVFDSSWNTQGTNACNVSQDLSVDSKVVMECLA